MAIASLILLALLWAAPAGAQDQNPAIDPKQVPQTGATPKDFVPAGWNVVRQIEGPLTSSTQPDVALHLAEDASNYKGYRAHDALLILSRNPAGGFQRAALAPKLILGFPEEWNVSIVKGVLIVTQARVDLSARVSHLRRFRYDPPSKRFLLIGEDTTLAWESGRSEAVSTNFLTGSQIVQKLQYELKSGRDVVVATENRTVARSGRPIEQLEYAFAAVPDDPEGYEPVLQSDRILVKTLAFDSRQAVATAPGRFVGVPQLLLEKFLEELLETPDPANPESLSELARQLVVERLPPGDLTSVERQSLPDDAEFYELSGPHVYCGSAGCQSWTYWVSPSTNSSGAVPGRGLNG